MHDTCDLGLIFRSSGQILSTIGRRTVRAIFAVCTQLVICTGSRGFVIRYFGQFHSYVANQTPQMFMQETYAWRLMLMQGWGITE
jgi:hypothetical protein